MYYPYFRGKQFELIAIRESAATIAAAGFVPIVEPVREQFSGLKKALDSLCGSGANAIVITNPQLGDLIDSGRDVVSFLKTEYPDHPNIRFGLVVNNQMTMEQVTSSLDNFGGHPSDLIHFGFSEPKALGEFAKNNRVICNIFPDGYTGKLYQRNFKSCDKRILIRDGFEKRRNRDHPDTPEFFSDLHITYVDEGMDGFGDFLTVGDEFQEGGGPAYTIAIHLTFIDSSKDDAMYVQHFKSDRQDTPQDPAGKFAEALAKLVDAVEAHDSKFFRTSALEEFRQLHEEGHYPGLGYVKKLSMKHHVETLAQFLGEQ